MEVISVVVFVAERSDGQVVIAAAMHRIACFLIGLMAYLNEWPYIFIWSARLHRALS